MNIYHIRQWLPALPGQNHTQSGHVEVALPLAARPELVCVVQEPVTVTATETDVFVEVQV